MSCDNPPIKKPKNKTVELKEIEEKVEKKIINNLFVLNDKNAIPFFFEYNKNNKENKVRIETKFGNIDLLLFSETPYHRSNFIFLTKKKIL